MGSAGEDLATIPSGCVFCFPPLVLRCSSGRIKHSIDWICRDFFAYLYHRANTFISVPGTLENMYLGNDWQSRTESAYRRAAKACDHEKYNRVEAAGEEWQKVFGAQIPRTI